MVVREVSGDRLLYSLNVPTLDAVFDESSDQLVTLMLDGVDLWNLKKTTLRRLPDPDGNAGGALTFDGTYI